MYILYSVGYNLKLATIVTLQYSFNIAFPIEDFSTQLAVRQNTVVAIVLQGVAADLQALRQLPVGQIVFAI